MNTIDLQGRTAIVTGAARGIGHGIATRLLASSAAVGLRDIDETAVSHAATSLAPWVRCTHK